MKKSKKRKCIILIDGSNFYFKLKDLKLHNLLSFDFTTFAAKLVGKDALVSTTYYVGKVRTGKSKKAKKMQADQQRLFAHLKKNKIRYSLGYLMKAGRKYHEKGVDVNIAVDMVVAAYENLCDRIILVSSDTDLIPAVLKAKEKGKQVEYVGFSHKASLGMVAECTESTLLKKEELKDLLGQ